MDLSARTSQAGSADLSILFDLSVFSPERRADSCMSSQLESLNILDHMVDIADVVPADRGSPGRGPCPRDLFAQLALLHQRPACARRLPTLKPVVAAFRNG